MEIKKCPFCGKQNAKARYIIPPESHNYGGGVLVRVDQDWFVRCDDCLALGPTGLSKGEAVFAWNAWKTWDDWREKYAELWGLIVGLDLTISCNHLDMGGNHKYALTHKSSEVIGQIKAFIAKNDPPKKR